jgi:hypothetical protein
MSSIKQLSKKGLSPEEIAYIWGTDVGAIRLKLKALAEESEDIDEVLEAVASELVSEVYEDVAEDDYSEESRP